MRNEYGKCVVLVQKCRRNIFGGKILRNFCEKCILISGRRPSILKMGQGLVQDSPTSPDSGISSGSSYEDTHSARKDLNTGSPKEKVHFTFPRPAENLPGIPYPPTMVRPSSIVSSPSSVITASTASMVSSAVVWNVAYQGQSAPTGIATSVVQTPHIQQESRGAKSEEDEKDLMCSDEEFSDESSGSEELNEGLYAWMMDVNIIRHTVKVLLTT